MTQAAETPADRLADPEAVRDQLAGKHVCPFCGALRADPNQPCPRCTMEDSPTTRTATRQRIGPWFVLQARNPSAPGMRFQTLLSLVKKGHVTPRSILRGPTTHQLWAFAARVKGLSREFGLCYHCGTSIDLTTVKCSKCDRPQEPPAFPDTLLETSDPTRHESVARAEAAPATVVAAAATLTAAAPVLNPATAKAQPEAERTVISEAPAVKIDAPKPQPTTSPLTIDPFDQPASLMGLLGNTPTAKPRRVEKPAPAKPVMSSSFTPAAPIAEKNAASGEPAVFKLSTEPGNADSGMDGGVSLDLQVDPVAPSTLPTRRAPAPLRPAPPPGQQLYGQMKTDEGILSAKELAAAFQLDFRPAGKRRRFGKSKTLFALLLIAAVSAGILFYLRPDYRVRSTEWARGAWSSGQAYFNAPAATRPATAAAPAAATRPLFPSTPKPIRPADAGPVATAPAQTVPPAVVTPAPQPKPFVAEPPPETAPPIDPVLAVEQARMLRGRAIDAEFQRDYPLALKLYQQIERLPREAWPPDLQVRLDEVKRKAK